MRQKAIQGLLSRFRWSQTTSIFDGFLADLNRALSALFSKIRHQKIENSSKLQMEPDARLLGLSLIHI